VGSEARLPSPGRVFQEIVTILQEDFWAQFWASIVRVVAGFFAAVLIGTPVGLLMGRSKYWSNFLQSPVIVAGSIPGLTYAVMAFVVFGISFWGPVLAVGLIAMPYVAINVAEGVRGVDRRLVDMSTAYGRNERQVFRHVVVPSVLPSSSPAFASPSRWRGRWGRSPRCSGRRKGSGSRSGATTSCSTCPA
jgi:NitT/TauT family transport system permease protein